LAFIRYDSPVWQSDGKTTGKYLVYVLEDWFDETGGGGDVGGSVEGFEPSFFVPRWDTKFVKIGVDLETCQERAFSPTVTWYKGAYFWFSSCIYVSYRFLRGVLYIFNLPWVERHPQ